MSKTEIKWKETTIPNHRTETTSWYGTALLNSGALHVILYHVPVLDNMHYACSFVFVKNGIDPWAGDGEENSIITGSVKLDRTRLRAEYDKVVSGMPTIGDAMRHIHEMAKAMVPEAIYGSDAAAKAKEPETAFRTDLYATFIGRKDG